MCVCVSRTYKLKSKYLGTCLPSFGNSLDAHKRVPSPPKQTTKSTMLCSLQRRPVKQSKFRDYTES